MNLDKAKQNYKSSIELLFGTSPSSKCSTLKAKQPLQSLNTSSSICSFPNCIMKATGKGRFYCRKCTGTYCSLHTGHQSLILPLNPQTGEISYDKNGQPSRVCETCFTNEQKIQNSKIKPNFEDLTDVFLEAREEFYPTHTFTKNQKIIETYHKFVEFYRFTPFPSPLDLRDWEMLVVEWKSGGGHCQQCGRHFNRIFEKSKHHCRLCGVLICDQVLVNKDIGSEIGCSQFITIKPCENENMDGKELLENVKKDIQVRCCRPCASIVTDYQKDTLSPTTKRVRKLFRQILDIKQQSLTLLNQSESVNENEQKCIRKTLILQFKQLNELACTIRSIDPEDIVCESVYGNTRVFIKEYFPRIPPQPSTPPQTQTHTAQNPSQKPVNWNALESKLIACKLTRDHLEQQLAQCGNNQDRLLIETQLFQFDQEISLLQAQTNQEQIKS